mgnify:CR=1 FL=1
MCLQRKKKALMCCVCSHTLLSGPCVGLSNSLSYGYNQGSNFVAKTTCASLTGQDQLSCLQNLPTDTLVTYLLFLWAFQCGGACAPAPGFLTWTSMHSTDDCRPSEWIPGFLGPKCLTPHRGWLQCSRLALKTPSTGTFQQVSGCHGPPHPQDCWVSL